LETATAVFVQYTTLPFLQLKQQCIIINKSGSGTIDRTANGQPADTVGSGQILHVHLPDGSTFLHKRTSWMPSWTYDVKKEIWLINWCVFLYKK